jgi:hypothetical protein
VAKPDLKKSVAKLSDIDLVRMLTVNAKESTPEVLTLAEAEAKRRGVPIDEAFIPSASDESAPCEPLERYEICGAPVSCPHCKGDTFQSRDILLNTRGLTFLRLDWLNQSATAMICTQCGLVQLFAKPPGPESAEPSDESNM